MNIKLQPTVIEQVDITLEPTAIESIRGLNLVAGMAAQTALVDSQRLKEACGVLWDMASGHFAVGRIGLAVELLDTAKELHRETMTEYQKQCADA